MFTSSNTTQDDNNENPPHHQDQTITPVPTPGRGKGGKGLGFGDPIKRHRKVLYEPPQNPRQAFRTLDDGYYLESAKKKKLNTIDDDHYLRKRNEHHEWLNTVVLRNVYEYLDFGDQLSFRLVNCGMNQDLGLWGDEEFGERSCPWYAFQSILKFERFCREMKMDEDDSMKNRKILFKLSGCLNRIQGEVRNAQVCSKTLLERGNPFKNYFIDGVDLNFEELVKNTEYVNLFRSGAVKYTDWVACTLKFSESSSCEIRIKKKSKGPNSKPSYVYLSQSHFVGVNGREGTNDESYYMFLREEGSKKSIPLMEYLFYRDPTGEGYTKKTKLQKLIKTCELPSDWDYEKLITFLMLCSNSFLIRMDYDNINLWERIKASAVFSENLNEDDEIEQEEEDEDAEKDEEDDGEEDEDDESRLFQPFEGDEIVLEHERSGKEFMNELLSKCCHQRKSISQTYTDLVSLWRIVLNVCSRSNFGDDIPEEYLGFVEIIKSSILNVENSTGFFVSIGEYVSQSRSFAEATLLCEKSKLMVEAHLSNISGYHSREISFKLVSQKDKSVLIDFLQDDNQQSAIVSPEFKIQILGKEAASSINDSTFIALFGLLCLRVHTFVFVDERMIRCIDGEMCCINPLMEIFDTELW